VPVDINGSGIIIERRFLVVFLTMIALLQLDMNVYRFESGYTEVWYQLPVFCLVDSQHFQVTADTFHDSYSYEFYIKNIDGTDSAYFEGRKTIVSCYGNGDELIVDRIPLNLYNGRFQYTLHITAVTGEMHSGGSIEIAPDTTFLACSDVILGHLDHGDFRFRDIPFLPSLAAGFIDQEVLFSYMEIYGLVPDSLYYEAFYKVTDREGAPIIREKRACMKHDYVQIDTHSFQITGLADGEYVYGVSINDPASQSSVTRTANFAVKTVGAIARGEFTREVQYLIDGREYEYFQDLSETQKEVYLKEFWARHDYRRFEKRIHEADQRFSVGRLPGRDSERGRLYILLGPPDEIETTPIAAWSRPFEVWRYYGKNDYLFCDIKNDQNPRLIRVLKPGEIERIIQTGLRDGTREEDWLSDIAPGTHDWHKDLESVE
jgi:GWxTD domain-containing protein